MTKQRSTSPPREGFTLVEITVVILILGILFSVGFVSYARLVDRARLVQAMGDLKAISVSVDNFYMLNKVYPATLGPIGMDGREDPWETVYVYLRVADPDGGPRTDEDGNPINTDYELYSHGVDGATSAPLNAANAADDVVRAANGGFLGLASNFGGNILPD